MNKKGQFFLFAALIIVVLIIGLATVYNKSTTPKEDTRLYDLSSDLKGEAGQVINYGSMQGLSEEQTLSNIKSFINISSNINKDDEFIIIFGNSANIFAYSFSFIYNTVGIESAGSVKVSKRELTLVQPTLDTNTNKIIVTLPNEQKYYFDLKEGQNFYLILKKEKGDSNIVVTK